MTSHRILGIDAANIRDGGGLTHLTGLLREADPAAAGFDRVVVWGGRRTLDQFAPRPWLELRHVPALDGGLLARTWWQWRVLSAEARRAHCDLLFVPGGSYAGDFRPFVTLSQNLLPFEWRETRRYGWSLMTLKFLALRWSQTRTFRAADGLLFASEYARAVVSRVVGRMPAQVAVTPNGVDAAFGRAPRPQRSLAECSAEQPFRLLYVSIVDVYKHQDVLATAVARMRHEDGLPVTLDLIGRAYGPALRRLQRVLRRVDPEGTAVRYRGHVSYEALVAAYADADAFVFASSCENMPIIVLEAMAAGLPVACAARGPMPEILGDAAVYFDPEHGEDVVGVLRAFLESPDTRVRAAQAAAGRGAQLSWHRCATESLAFMARVVEARPRVHV